MILRRVTSSPLLIFSVVSITAAVTITGGLGQTAIRKVITYSSLNNVSWIVIRETIRGYTWALYFASYCVLIVPLVVAIVALGGGYRDQLMAGRAPRQNVALVLFGLFSLGGLPPLLGFFNKLLIVKLLVAGEGLILLLTVVLSSLALLYFYTNLAFYTLSCGPESTLPSNKRAHRAVAKALAGGPILSVFIFCGAGGA